MNLLIHKLPKTDKYGVKIETSFRNWINFELAMHDESMQESERILCGLSSVYDLSSATEKDIQERIEGATDFINGWQTQTNETASTKERAFDFGVDAPQIYASFLMQYGINLTNVKMHWYEFMPLLVNLSQDTPMGNIMYIRTCDLTGMPKEQKKHMQKLKRLYRLDYIEYNPEEIVKQYTMGAKNG